MKTGRDFVTGIVVDVIAEIKGTVVVEMEVRLGDGLGMDSLEVIDMAMRLEDSFQIAIPDDEMRGYGQKTVLGVVDSVCLILGTP